MSANYPKVIKPTEQGAIEANTIKPLSKTASLHLRGDNAGSKTSNGLEIDSLGIVSGNRLQMTSLPTVGDDLVNKTHLDSELSTLLPQNVGTTDTPTFAQVTITNTPSNNSDVATKVYVDSNIALGPSSVFYGFYLASSDSELKYDTSAGNSDLDFDTYSSFIITSGTTVSIVNNKLQLSL